MGSTDNAVQMELPHLDGTTATPDEVAAKLQSHGVVVLEKVVGNDDMDRLASDLDKAQGKFYGAKGSFAGAHTTRNAGKPLGESVVAQQLAENPLVFEAIKLRMKKWCRKVVLGTCSNINVEPPPSADIPPAPAQVLHRDESMWAVSDWSWCLPTTDDSRPEFCISVMWAITDFTNENGATRVIPGSHRWKRNDAIAALDDLGAEGDATKWSQSEDIDELAKLEAQCIQAVMPKGSVLIWSGATLHGQSSHAPRVDSTSSSDDVDEECLTRRGLLFIYNLGWLRPEHNFHWALPPDVFASFPQSLRELLGMVGNNRVDHPWYTGPVYAQPILYGPGEEDDDEVFVRSTSKS